MSDQRKWFSVLAACTLALGLALTGCGDGDGKYGGGGGGGGPPPAAGVQLTGAIARVAPRAVAAIPNDMVIAVVAISYPDGAIEDFDILAAGETSFTLDVSPGADYQIEFREGDENGDMIAVLLVDPATGRRAFSIAEDFADTNLGDIDIDEDTETATSDQNLAAILPAPTGDTTAPTVAANPEGGTFSLRPPTVTLSATDDQDPNPLIFFTRDGSDPTTSSARATAPFPIYATAVTDTTTVNFFATDAAGNDSDVASEMYTVSLVGKGAEWQESGHADSEGEPFTHWDEDGEVPTSCAKCHSRWGFLDYAMDGTVDEPAPLGTVVDCDACHPSNSFATLWDDLETYPALENIEFPSGETANLFGPSNMCMACHQGRSSKDDVDETIEENPGGPYTFINIHYFAAAATYFGTEVRGGYEYDGMEYVPRNPFPSHPETLRDCAGCHMRGDEADHHFDPVLEDCTSCHEGDSFETLSGSPSANHADLEALSEALLDEIQDYATNEIGTDIAYDPSGYPYFFKDTNGNGEVDEDEANFGNRYNEFDAKLLKAAYNYQVDQKDPCDYIHNGTYSKQLLFDSIVDLGGTPPEGVTVPGRTSLAAAGEFIMQTGEWHLSGHADTTGEAFRHWDEDDPAEVSTSCAKCHSSPGFVDYTEDGSVDEAVPVASDGVVVDCVACHTDLNLYEDADTRFDVAEAGDPDAEPPVPADPLYEVEFPSGESVSLFNSSNICMACHQGRSSKDDVDEAIDENPAGPYTFINIHYYAAAATYFGTEVRGGYEYDSMEYVPRNTFPSHPSDLKDCVGCHMRGDDEEHTFEAEVADCTGCHSGDTFQTLGGTPGMNYSDLQTLSEALLGEIQSYATNTIEVDIAYDAHAYPYFFKDTNGNGEADEDEVNFGNRYDQFDAKLLKAAYNYQVDQKDPCDYIHNGIYAKQLLYDSIRDLGGTPPASVVVPGRTSLDTLEEPMKQTAQWHLSGHADATGEAFRHWDEDGEVSTSCAECHSTPGFLDFVEDGTVDAAAPLGTLVECTACHTDANLYQEDQTWYDVAMADDPLFEVLFPSGASQTLGNSSNICMACHQGRASGLTVENADPNTVEQDPDYESYDFINRHYFAAAAIMFGSDVTAGFEYAGKVYKGENAFSGAHGARVDCTGCHLRGEDDHEFEVQLEDCSNCHQDVPDGTTLTDFEKLGAAFQAPVDYDGDGTGGSFQAEIDGMKAALYSQIQSYAMNTLSSPIIYQAGAYPYFFKDTNGNGEVDDGEASFGNRYRDFDKTLLQAAYNFHSAQDPCGDIHNYQYVIQTLYDSLEDLGGDVSGMIRP